MPNFKLVFSSVDVKRKPFGSVRVTSWKKSETKIERVIVAKNIEYAKKIAKAMKFDIFNVPEVLRDVLSVEETSEKPHINQAENEIVWKHVLRGMELTPYEVNFVYEQGQKVGFFQKPFTEIPSKVRVLAQWAGCGPSTLCITTELLDDNDNVLRSKYWGYGSKADHEDELSTWFSESNVTKPLPCEIFMINDEFGPHEYADPEAHVTHKHPKFFSLLKEFVYPKK